MDADIQSIIERGNCAEMNGYIDASVKKILEDGNLPNAPEQLIGRKFRFDCDDRDINQKKYQFIRFFGTIIGCSIGTDFVDGDVDIYVTLYVSTRAFHTPRGPVEGEKIENITIEFDGNDANVFTLNTEDGDWGGNLTLL